MTQAQALSMKRNGSSASAAIVRRMAPIAVIRRRCGDHGRDAGASASRAETAAPDRRKNTNAAWIVATGSFATRKAAINATTAATPASRDRIGSTRVSR